MTAIIESLRDRSRRPHHHPNQHTPEEIKLIKICVGAIPILVWLSFGSNLCSAVINVPSQLYRFLKQGILAQNSIKYIPKPYEQMKYPGQRIGVDVKFVPACCLVNNAGKERNSQYNHALVENSAGYVEAFEEHSAYSSAQFLKHLIPTLSYANQMRSDRQRRELQSAFSTSGKETLTLFQRTLRTWHPT